MEVSGSIAVGEGAAALVRIGGRLGLSIRQRLLVLLVCMVGIGMPLAAWASGSRLDALLGVEGALIGLFVGVLIVWRLDRPLMRKALARRGQSAKHRLTVWLMADTLAFEVDDVTTTAR